MTCEHPRVQEDARDPRDFEAVGVCLECGDRVAKFWAATQVDADLLGVELGEETEWRAANAEELAHAEAHPEELRHLAPERLAYLDPPEPPE